MLFITLNPKVLEIRFLIRWLYNFGTFIEFHWLVHKVECPSVSKGVFCVLTLGMFINLSAFVLSFRIPENKCAHFVREEGDIGLYIIPLEFLLFVGLNF